MIESLHKYIELVSVDPEHYVDRSGLYEIIESIYIQLCNSNPWFSAYTEYSYSNVIKEHQIEISKQIDLDNKVMFSTILISEYCGKVEITRYDCDFSNEEKIPIKKISHDFHELGYSTFQHIYNYLKNWFDEILIHVKEYNTINKKDEK